MNRSDDGREFWDIVIGAAVSAVSQLIDDPTSWNTKEFWARTGTAAAVGAVSGGLAASGVGIVGQIAWNAALGAAGNVADAALQGKKSVSDYILCVIEGAVFGAAAGGLGGAGSASKHVSNSFWRTVKNGNWSYYLTQIGKQAINDGKQAIPSILKATIPNATKVLIQASVKYEECK